MVIAQYAPCFVLSIQPVIWCLNAAHCQHRTAAFTRLVYLTNICRLRIFVNCGNGVLLLVLTNRVSRWMLPKSKELPLLFNWRRRLSWRSHDWFILDKQSTGLCAEYQSVLRLSSYTSRGIAALDLLILGTKLNPFKPSGYYMYCTTRFNIWKFVYCVAVRTNSHYFPIQH